MTSVDPRATEFLDRVDRVEKRLRRHSEMPPAPGLTLPDAGTGEQWDYGQVWAHLAEFVPYWLGQASIVLHPATGEPVPFGRVMSDPARVAAIARDRNFPVPALMVQLGGHLDDLRQLITGLAPQDWERQGVHSRLGVMDVHRILEEFLVGHLESHAMELDYLRENWP
jgi:hypothetical protein